MATSYDEIIGFIKEEKLLFKDARDSVGGLALYFVSGEDDEKPELVIIRLHDDGKFVCFFGPQRYKYLEGEHKLPLLETLLKIHRESKMLRWEYNPDNGEICACVELPLEDAKLTKKLFMRVLMDFVKMMDTRHDRIQAVIDTGVDPGQ